MSTRTTSYALGEKLDAFIAEQVACGKYATASDVVRAALEALADERRREAFEREALEHALASNVRHSSAETWRSVDAAVAQAKTRTRRQVVSK
jgi:antitoxin ParD1/3/4